MEPIAELEIADSHFLGFCCSIQTVDQASSFQLSLKAKYPDAAHVPIIWRLSNDSSGYDEDGEPPQSTGPGMLKETLSNQTGVAIGIVRYFGSRLLGVTCGRLSQCYQSIAGLTLHRYLSGRDTPLITEIMQPECDIYGMAAGDTELILGVVKGEKSDVLDRMKTELNYDGFKGAKGEELPRLQNLQANIGDGSIPIYRYPGNYSGQEWETFQWSPTSKTIKTEVEEALKPLTEQIMNHGVTNYYRDGKDFIAHHSDKDLDLNRDGVIVSVSLGDERVMELRRRAEPRDVTRIILPHGSMLVLGPKTNKLFSHSILPNPSSVGPRISLTLRDVKTFLDLDSGRLYGQGVAKTLKNVRKGQSTENGIWLGGLCAFSGWLIASRRPPKQSLLLAGLFAVGSLSWRHLSKRWRATEEERLAREFFSKKSMSGTKY